MERIIHPVTEEPRPQRPARRSSRLLPWGVALIFPIVNATVGLQLGYAYKGRDPGPKIVTVLAVLLIAEIGAIWHLLRHQARESRGLSLVGACVVLIATSALVVYVEVILEYVLGGGESG